MARPKKDTSKPAAKVAKSITSGKDTGVAMLAPAMDISELSLADLVAAQRYILDHEMRKTRGAKRAEWGKRRASLKAEIQRRIKAVT